MSLTARKSDNYRYHNSWKVNNYKKRNEWKKQRNYTEKEGKKINSNKVIRSNREKFIVITTILKKWIIRQHHNYFAFYRSSPMIFLSTKEYMPGIGWKCLQALECQNIPHLVDDLTVAEVGLGLLDKFKLFIYPILW